MSTITNTMHNVTQQPFMIRKVNIVLLIVAIVAVLAYMGLLGRTVFAVVARKSVEAESKLIGSDMATLEVNYLKKTAGIDIEMARSLGFSDKAPITFAKDTATAMR